MPARIPSPGGAPSTHRIASLPPAPVSTDVAIVWRHHSDPPTQRTRAIIAIRPAPADRILLPEMYDWDTVEKYWVSASTRLNLRHKEFHWAPVDPLLWSAP